MYGDDGDIAEDNGNELYMREFQSRPRHFRCMVRASALAAFPAEARASMFDDLPPDLEHAMEHTSVVEYHCCHAVVHFLLT